MSPESKAKLPWFERMLNYVITGLLAILSLPVSLYRAMFYPPVLVNGEYTRPYFSLTRSLLALSGYIVCAKLLIGGLVLEDVHVGPETTVTVKQTKPKSVPVTRSSVGKEVKVGPVKIGGIKRVKRIKKQKTRRGWFYIQKLSFAAFTLYDVCMFLCIVLVYFLRNRLNAGDTTGLFDDLVRTGVNAALAKYGIMPQAPAPASPVGTPPVLIPEPSTPPPALPTPPPENT